MVKRPLKIDGKYVITEAPAPLDTFKLIGHKCRVLVQLADEHLPGRLLSVEAILQSGPYAGQRLTLHGVRLRADSAERVCRCRAYSFPHSARTGSCYSSDEGPFCGTCGRPTSIVRHGEKPASLCCAGDLFNDAELKEAL